MPDYHPNGQAALVTGAASGIGYATAAMLGRGGARVAVNFLPGDPSFAQWTRAKSFDGFSPLGPVIATGLDPDTLVVRTVLNGTERQNYPVSDMVFPPATLVSLLSHSVMLMPGDVICCGTSLGVGAMREASNTVDVVIDGIGTLRSYYQQPG